MYSRKRKSSPRVIEPLLEDSENTYVNPLLDDLDDSASATEAYRTAMTCIGSSSARSSQHVKPFTQKVKSNCSALIKEDEYVDDWLVDDLQPVKRRKMDVNGLFSTRTSKSMQKKKKIHSNHRTEQKQIESGKFLRCRIEDSDIESDNEYNSVDMETNIDSHIDDCATNTNNNIDTVSESDILIDDLSDVVLSIDSDSEIPPINRKGSSASVSKPKQTRITSFGTRTMSNDFFSNYVSSVNMTGAIVQSTSSESSSRDVEISSVNVVPVATQQNTIQSPTAGMLTGVIRVKVQIKDKLLLIPIIDR